MTAALSRDRWIDAGLAALAAEGLDAVRVESLARHLHVTKGSFYWHFRDRNALLAAMLERWERVATQAIIEEVEALTGPADVRLRVLFEIALAARVMALEIALREWARGDERVARVLKRVDDRRLRYLRRLFEELGLEPVEARARSFLAYAVLFGDHFITAGAEPEQRRSVLNRCTRLLLTVPRSGGARSRRR